MTSFTPSVARCLRLASQNSKQAGSLVWRSLPSLDGHSSIYTNSGNDARCGHLAIPQGLHTMSTSMSRIVLFYLKGRHDATHDTFTRQLSTPATQTASDADRLFASVILTVKGSDEAVLDSYTQFVTRAATVMNLDITGRVVLPMNIELKTLLASPHIFKKARVQYELRTHGRKMQINKLTGDTADVFLEYIQRNLPEGVSMSVEQDQLEALPEFLKQVSMSTEVSITEKTTAENSVAEKSSAENSVVEMTAAENTVVEKSAAEKLTAEKSAAEKSAAEAKTEGSPTP